MPKIIAITRIRNEEEIIKDTLDHVSQFVDNIYVYDDCSTDKTVDICLKHDKVNAVIYRRKWETDPVARNKAEGDYRQKAYERAFYEGAEWIFCFDADEFADFDGIDLTGGVDAYRMRLYDFYITEADKDLQWKDRQFMGPEYRDILMLFRAHPDVVFRQREPRIPSHYKIAQAGSVKHYGKAISIEEWGKTCDYYVKYRGGDLLPQFTNKWKARKGKAIHTRSDFGAELITWQERHEKGFPLVDPKEQYDNIESEAPKR